LFAFHLFSVNWILAVLGAIPYLLFTTINYLEYPQDSGSFLEDSAFCALLDINITPQVRKQSTFMISFI
jgi:hypothetical protein